MDYEQKYKCLVNAVKILKETNPSDEGIQNWVIDNVPELADSEDARIRSNIIAALKGVGYYDCDLTNECIDWIEKQCNPKPYWKPTKEQYEALDYAYNSCPDTEIGNYYEGVLATIIDDLQRLEKQGEQIPANSARTCKDEQKPSEWSESDRLHLGGILSILKAERNNTEIEQYRDSINSDIDWLKSITQRIVG